MPLIPIDYSKTIIYKIQHKEKKELFYIGHTTNFDSRKSQHKLSVLTKTGKLYEAIRAYGGWNNFEMVPVREANCKNRIEALIEEQRSMDELRATLNSKPAYKETAQHTAREYHQREYANTRRIINIKYSKIFLKNLALQEKQETT